MPVKDRYVKVPAELAEDIAAVAPFIVEEARKQDQQISDSDFQVEGSSGQGVLFEATVGAILFVAGVAAQSITKKWVEEVLWPRLKPRVEKNTDLVLDFLLGVAAENERAQDDE